jgi:ABC-type uncharacterized transport system auxiliary subunit
MKEQIKNMRLILVILFSLLFLQACGGSNDTTPTFTISASVSSLACTHEFLQAQNHTIALDGVGLLLGFAPTATPVDWLNYRIANITATSAIIHPDASMMLAKAVETNVIDENTIETSIHRCQINLS